MKNKRNGFKSKIYGEWNMFFSPNYSYIYVWKILNFFLSVELLPTFYTETINITRNVLPIHCWWIFYLLFFFFVLLYYIEWTPINKWQIVGAMLFNLFIWYVVLVDLSLSIYINNIPAYHVNHFVGILWIRTLSAEYQKKIENKHLRKLETTCCL